jgi:predicted DNA-binding transcriptional regulator AlpA
MGDRLLSLSEVSARTGFALSTLYEMRCHGAGPPSVRIGSRVKVRESALEQWIKAAEAAEQARLRRKGA